MAVCQRTLSCFLSPCRQPGRQAQGGEVCPTPRGYLTNLFDVADPDTELPHCSDHRDGETLTLPLLLLLFLLLLLTGRDSVGVKRRCGELGSGYLLGDDTEQSHPSCCAIESHRPPCGCYSNRRSGRLLLPPIYLTDFSVRIAPNYRPGCNSAHQCRGLFLLKDVVTFKPCLWLVVSQITLKSVEM